MATTVYFATNRVIAGVHFPVDSMAGRMLGVALGEYFVGRCITGKHFKGRKFIASWIDNAAATDFNPFSSDQKLDAGKLYSETPGGNIAPSNVMPHMWNEAKAEWSGRFGVPPPP